MRRWVTNIAVPYAFYVPTNLSLFWFFQPADNLPPLAFMVGYLFTLAYVAAGVTYWTATALGLA
ncbi:MAG: hypothetical protein CMN59_01970 [Sphingobium sp.]|nr:hypothetical protein [Sphingobium sp.]